MISGNDKKRLEALAHKTLETANSERNKNLKEKWLNHNTFKGTDQPPVTVELWTFASEIIPPMLECKDEAARGLEHSLLYPMICHDIFKDDTVINDHFPINYGFGFKPFGLDPKVIHEDVGIAYHFDPVIVDLKEDFGKLSKSSWWSDKASAADTYNLYSDLIGHILPVKYSGRSLTCSPTQNLVHLMGMENMFFAMGDYPELFSKVMDNLANDYVEYFDFLAREGVLLSTTENQQLCQGTVCYTDELSEKPQSPHDIWGYIDSQETVGVSKDMFEQCVFPCIKKVAASYGLLSYGCCEPVDVFWDGCLDTLTNMRKVSISPWCNEEFMGERLQGKNIVYLRKSSPNFLGVGTTLDEDALKSHILKTKNAARGCTLEFAQRDVYTVGGNIAKVARYVEIVKGMF